MTKQYERQPRHRYFYLRVDELSDRGFNAAIEVYKLTAGYPKFIGGNYRLDTHGWAGERVEARCLVAEKCGHKLPDRYRDFPSKSVTLCDITGN